MECVRRLYHRLMAHVFWMRTHVQRFAYNKLIQVGPDCRHRQVDIDLCRIVVIALPRDSKTFSTACRFPFQPSPSAPDYILSIKMAMYPFQLWVALRCFFLSVIRKITPQTKYDETHIQSTLPNAGDAQHT